MSNDDQLKYPIGGYSPKESYTDAERAQLIDTIESLPEKVETLIRNISEQQLDTPYREGGWTVRQVIHHLADSHMNACIRLYCTVTEDAPVREAYDEKAWALTAETTLDPVISVNVLKALHQKWSTLLKLLTPDQLKRSYIHPDNGKHVTLERQLALYAWHCDHHI